MRINRDGIKYNIAIVLGVAFSLFCFYFSSSASSLTYQSSVGVNFTFNSALNVSLSGNLVINNLTPGSSSDSNVIDVSVSTNASYGYVLSATVGQKNGTTSLVNNTSSSNTFTNLNANKATLSNFTDNTWGYSYSVDNGTNWISGSTGSTSSGYNGLPLDNNDNAEERGKGGITLIDTDNPLDNQTIKFKIGAKASASQPAGTYTNTINFYAVANAGPMSISDAYSAANKSKFNGYYKMQDMSSTICSNVELEDEASQTRLIDTRDNRVYWVAKLADGNCWMTQNLDLDLSTQRELSSLDTDLNNTTLSGAYSAGYRRSGGVTYWTPNSSTINGVIDDSDVLFPGWSDSNTLPFSASVGNYYIDAPTTYNAASISNTPFPSNMEHGAFGNHYNWSAAIASNNSSSLTTNTVAGNSICPVGWKLSTGSEYTQLLNQYDEFGSSPWYLVDLGTISYDSGTGGGRFGGAGWVGGYWSSNPSNDIATSLQAYTVYANVATSEPRYIGYSVRCTAR